MKKLRELNRELSELTDFFYICRDPRVQKAVEEVRKERAPRIKELQTSIQELQAKQPAKKPRFPANTPQDIIDFCNEYWKGTTDFHTYRIHCWNNKAVWTSYPSGGYSDNGGYNPTPAAFYLLSRTEDAIGGRPKIITTLEGRVSLRTMQEALDAIN